MTVVHLDATAEELLADWLACFRLENPAPWSARQKLTRDCAVLLLSQGRDLDNLERAVEWAEQMGLERNYDATS